MRHGDPSREAEADAGRASDRYSDYFGEPALARGRAGRSGYRSSHTSSMRQPLKRLLVIVVSPLSRGCMQVAKRE